MKPTLLTPLACMWAITASAMRSSFWVVLNTHFFFSSMGWTMAEEPTVVTRGVLASATKSSMARAAGLVVGPIRASTLCSPISFFTAVTALVGSDASSRTMYSTFCPPISAGSRATLFFWGMPTWAVTPVEEAMTPIFTWARAGPAIRERAARRAAGKRRQGAGRRAFMAGRSGKMGWQDRL